MGKEKSTHSISTEGEAPPVCPHCEAELGEIRQQRVDQSLGRAHVWSCPFCRKVLGISHRKGFWMG
jgi:uncharacterized protein with PIN domain